MRKEVWLVGLLVVFIFSFGFGSGLTFQCNEIADIDVCTVADNPFCSSGPCVLITSGTCTCTSPGTYIVGVSYSSYGGSSCPSPGSWVDFSWSGTNVQCCINADCDDGNPCTINDCVAHQCITISDPDDSEILCEGSCYRDDWMSSESRCCGNDADEDDYNIVLPGDGWELDDGTWYSCPNDGEETCCSPTECTAICGQCVTGVGPIPEEWECSPWHCVPGWDIKNCDVNEVCDFSTHTCGCAPGFVDCDSDGSCECDTSSGMECDASDNCVASCVVDCTGLDCGPDLNGCGVCGPCADSRDECNAGACVHPTAEWLDMDDVSMTEVDAYWEDEGTEVYLIAENLGAFVVGDVVVFEIGEYDFMAGDDPIGTINGSVEEDVNGKFAKVYWNISNVNLTAGEYVEGGTEEKPLEFYFDIFIGGDGIIGSGRLEVNVIEDVVTETVPDVGICWKTLTEIQNCEDHGILEYSYTGVFVWDSDTNIGKTPAEWTALPNSGQYVSDPNGLYYYDPNKERDACEAGGTYTVDCPVEIGLPFFGLFNFISVFGILMVGYYFKRENFG